MGLPGELMKIEKYRCTRTEPWGIAMAKVEEDEEKASKRFSF